MNFQVAHGPVFTILEFQLNESDTIHSQPNNMLSMSAGVELSASVGRSEQKSKWTSGFKSLLGGENFFTAQFRAKRDQQTLVLAPDTYGEILPLKLSEGHGFFLTRGSYLANSGDSRIEVRYGGMKGLMAKTGLFLLHASGVGTVFCQSYGCVLHKFLDADEHLIIDNRYVIAFSDTVQYKLVKASSSIKVSLMSGEGLVNRFTGPGDVYYQTRGKPSVGFFSRILDAVF